MPLGAFLNLLYQTTRCSFLAQEKNSALGLLWHLLNPLAMTIVLYTVFAQVPHFGAVRQFPLFILLGVIQFNFFAQATAGAAEGMLASRNLLLNSTIPREILVLRSVCLSGLTYLIEVVVVALAIAVIGDGLSWNGLYYVVVIGGLFLLTLGCSLLLAGAVVFLTDLTYVWGLTTRLLFFLTPIFYAPEAVRHPLATRILALNPLAQMVTLGRQCFLYGQALGAAEIAAMLLGPTIVLGVGWQVFQLLKPHLAEYA